jgi:alkanesulfonate monooxygenase SsuD/methylene tetrahydromethanopterin reductase-like flavin-dependent oxidoreductase (luciferase family)
LRPSLYTAKEIMECVKIAEQSGFISHVFIPDIPGGLESVEISAAALAQTRNIKIGSGVIRLLEHDINLLTRRLLTLQTMSENRFILGVGTGAPGGNAAQTILTMLSSVDKLKTSFAAASKDSGTTFPDTFVATLKQRIAFLAQSHADGLLLNFCSPEYAEQLINRVCKQSSTRPDFACYLKIFYSPKKNIAERLLVEEFAKYDSIESYHRMFELDDISKEIAGARSALASNVAVIPERLLKVSLANPDSQELKTHVLKFRRAGIQIPCVYPYFERNENSEFKLSIIREISDSV